MLLLLVTTGVLKAQVPTPGGDGISGPVNVARNQSTSYSTQSTCGPYIWSVSNGTIQGSATGSSIVVLWNTAGTGNVALTWCNGNEFDQLSINVEQAVAAPGSITKTDYCGYTTITRPSPPSGVTFYWQSSASGTNTSNSNQNRNVGNGTYYLRARDNSTEAWSSGSSSISVSVRVQPPMPSTPAMSAVCGSTTITRPANTPSVSYYWQTGTSNPSTGNNSSQIVATSSGTYYLAALHTSSCWSDVLSFNVNVNQEPVSPPAPTETRYCGYTELSRVAPPAGIEYYWQTQAFGQETAPVNAAPTFTVTTPGTQTLYLGALNGDGCWSYTTIFVGVKGIAEAPVSSMDDHTFGNANVSPSVSGGGPMYKWYTQSSGGTAISGINGNVYSHSPAGTITYYVAGNNADGCESSTRIAVTAYKYPQPVLEAVGGATLPNGGTVTLQVNPAAYDSYSWMRNLIQLSGNNASISADQTGYYEVTVTIDGHTASTGLMVTPEIEPLSNNDRNHVWVTLVGQEGITDEALTGADENKLYHTFQYTDGLGRGLQSVSHASSPLGNDVIQTNHYDQFGTSTKGYLPYTASSASGQFRPDALSSNGQYEQSEQFQFYQNAPEIAHDTKPFSQVELDTSPFRNVLESGSVGAGWQPGENGVKDDWSYNSVTDNVRKWYINAQGRPQSDATYGTKTLTKGVTTSSENQDAIVFADFRGRVALQRTIAADGVTTLDSYTIYDDFDRPIFVLSPQAIKELEISGSYTPDNAFLDKWAFQYKYDDQGRLIESKAPGVRKWSKVVYDYWDRPILTQDANLENRDEWSYVKFDTEGRTVMTGYYSSAADRATLQAEVDQFYTGGTPRGEKRGTSLHDYTNVTFPTSIVEEDVFTVIYYDDYQFLNGNPELAYTQMYDNPATPHEFIRGMPTGSKTKVLDEPIWLTTVAYFDKRLRAIQSITEQYGGGIQRLTQQYDYEGQTVSTQTFQQENGGQAIITREFEYDRVGRLLNLYHQIEIAGQVHGRILLASYRYNEAGQVVEENLHSTDDGNTYFQSLDYRYDIRGWLKSINNAQLEHNAINNPDTGQNKDLFGLELIYQDTTGSGLE
ncbi:MAG: DUF6443 domain-containing protein [Bacteroidota bacterium]